MHCCERFGVQLLHCRRPLGQLALDDRLGDALGASLVLRRAERPEHRTRLRRTAPVSPRHRSPLLAARASVPSESITVVIFRRRRRSTSRRARQRVDGRAQVVLGFADIAASIAGHRVLQDAPQPTSTCPNRWTDEQTRHGDGSSITAPIVALIRSATYDPSVLFRPLCRGRGITSRWAVDVSKQRASRSLETSASATTTKTTGLRPTREEMKRSAARAPCHRCRARAFGNEPSIGSTQRSARSSITTETTR